jgi:hypothetical protein
MADDLAMRLFFGRLSGIAIWLLAALLSDGRAEAQTAPPELRHVQWPLLDIVMVPDSAALWIMAGPNPSTTQWQSSSYLVSLCIDPVAALEWVTIARKLVSLQAHLTKGDPAHFTPPLRAKSGPALAALATNPKKPSSRTKFVLLVSDSARNIRWKSFASSAQVDTLLAALEAAALASWVESRPPFWNTLADRDPDTPVSAVAQPRPLYPDRLVWRGKVGRVWMSYVVTSLGRAQQGSFFPLLSDDPLFTEAAIEALLQSRYQPAVLNGEPVPLRVFQSILFRRR